MGNISIGLSQFSGRQLVTDALNLHHNKNLIPNIIKIYTLIFVRLKRFKFEIF